MSAHRPLAFVLLLAAATAAAQSRPDEDQLFGAQATDGGTPAPPSAPGPERPSEGELFGTQQPSAPHQLEGTPTQKTSDEERLSGTSSNAFETGETQVDPLKVGGQFYLRSFAAFSENVPPSNGRLSAPTLVDVYMDARPTDRVRGFVLGRLSYDPTLDPNSSFGLLGSTTSSPLPQRANPSVALDQAWLRFDIGRKVFVTAGQQHVRWGTARIWSPTDFLTPQRRNPLLPFDPRVGASMVKLHVPWEEKGWNFYALGLLDNAGPANLIGRVGGAARAEVVLGDSEIGADVVLQQGKRPRAGFDFSAGLGPFDIYGEVALKTGSDTPLWRISGEFPAVFPQSYTPDGFTPAASGGISWAINYTENLTLTLSAEYFYNSNGYDSPLIYPLLILQGAYQPFYLGKHYAALFALTPAPWDKDKASLTLFNLANLSDRSFVSQLNFSQRVLTYLTLEAFAAVHYGNPGGEFRLRIDLPATEVAGQPIPAIYVPAPLFEVGIGARIAI